MRLLDEKRRAGFTILEIMISVAILTIGLMGILALFPVAIETSRITIEETNGVLIAQSVEQAIRESLKHRKGQSENGKWTYFLFHHDGVTDALPRRIKDADPGRDYYILLPDSDPERTTQTSREAAFRRAKTFVYPETDEVNWITLDGDEETEDSGHPPNGNGNPLRADDDRDDMELRVSEEDLDAVSEATLDDVEVVQEDFDVFNTYLLSQVDEDETDPVVLRDADDPLASYSYAFAIRRSYDDANNLDSADSLRRGGSTFSPQGELYQVKIMIFRSFRRGTSNADPIYETNFLVHK